LHGTTTYNAYATDCTGTAETSYDLTLDNSPTVTLTAPAGLVSGAFDITGNVTFKPTLQTIKGFVSAYVNGGGVATKLCTTENCAFSFKEIMGRWFELSHGGPYTVQLVATGGGASANDQKTFSVNNTPTVAVTGPIGTISGPFDITGTVSFKPTGNQVKGIVTAYLDKTSVATKVCTTESCAFSYKEITGRLFELSHGGPYTVQLVATGGGASANDQKTFSVNNTPTVAVTGPIGTISGPFDIAGTVTFKPTIGGTTGLIWGYINGSFIGLKHCVTENVPIRIKN
jgi:hypothetical protein